MFYANWKEFELCTNYASAYIETSQAVGVCANATYSLYFNSEYTSRKSLVKTSSRNFESDPKESRAPFKDTGMNQFCILVSFLQKVCRRFLQLDHQDQFCF